MTVDGEEPLRALRARLAELVDWLDADVARVAAAAAAQHRADDLRAPRARAEVDRLLLAAADERALAFAPLSAASSAAEAAAELAAIDRAAWLVAGAPRLAPPQLVGAADRARYVIRLAHERPGGWVPAGARGYLRCHAVAPAMIPLAGGACRVRIAVAASAAARCEAARARGEVAVATVRLPIDAARGAAPAPSRRALTAALRLAIGRAARAGADLLVAPAYALPAGERDALVERLRWAAATDLALLAPGSALEAAPGPGAVHRAVLLDGRGNTLAAHTQLAGAGPRGAPPAAPREVALLLTPLGSIALALEPDLADVDIAQVWTALAPDWLLVPGGRGPAQARDAAAPDAPPEAAAAHRGAAALRAAVGTHILLADEWRDRDSGGPEDMADRGLRASRSSISIHKFKL